MPEFRDLEGQTFGRLFVKEHYGWKNYKSGRKPTWLCICSCEKGSIKIVVGSDLISGNTRSCGCLQLEYATQSIHLKWNWPKSTHSNFHKTNPKPDCPYCKTKASETAPNIVCSKE